MSVVHIKEYDEEPTSSSETQISSSTVNHREYIVTIKEENGESTDSSSSYVKWKRIRVVSDRESKKQTQVSDNKSSNTFMLSDFGWKLRTIVFDLFLPVGYPQSVHRGYIEYQLCDSIQGLCSYLRGVVSTSAVLQAVGVGDAEATALSAAVQWALRDGLGMIGGLLFSYISSSHFDSHVKEFRLLADIANDIGLFLDMITPYVDRWKVIYFTSISTLCRVVCGMAAGASKGAITEHFSKNNIADLNAKEGTQETIVSIVGMMLGVSLANYIKTIETTKGEKEAFMVTWIIFCLLTFIHIFVNYIGVYNLRLRTLNRSRADISFGTIIKSSIPMIRENLINQKKMYVNEIRETIIRPEECYESIFKSYFDLLFSDDLRLGVGLKASLKGNLTPEYFDIVFGDTFANENYILFVKKSTRRLRLCGKKQNIYVSLRVGATDEDILKSYVHAIIVRGVLESTSMILLTHQIHQVIIQSKTLVDEIFQGDILTLKKLESKGWHSTLHLGYGLTRCVWSRREKDL